MLNNDSLNTAIRRTAVKIETLPAETVQTLEKNATLDHDEWFFFSDKSSLALASGFIDTDAAQQLHKIHTAFQNDGATLAERIVFLQVMGELAPAFAG